jgi:hypothetical protein
MRGPELLGNMVLPQPRAWRNLTTHDALCQCAADSRGNGIFGFWFRSFGHGMT